MWQTRWATSCRHACDLLPHHGGMIDDSRVPVEHLPGPHSLDGFCSSTLLPLRLLSSLTPPLDRQAIEDFPRNRRRLDGRDNRCKRCTARMVSSRLKAKPPVTEPTGGCWVLRNGFVFRVSGGPDSVWAGGSSAAAGAAMHALKQQWSTAEHRLQWRACKAGVPIAVPTAADTRCGQLDSSDRRALQVV